MVQKKEKFKNSTYTNYTNYTLHIQSEDEIEDPNNVTCERKWNFRGIKDSF